MNISFPDETYRTLLKEANRRDVPMARLCSELLQTAAKIIDITKTDNQTDNQRGNDEQQISRK
ncbi:hypothetical protein AB8Q55_20250 [Klebsiella pneumoniae]|nr:hypothetical protein [Klebsiella pneumoniae]ELA1747292.1 hypothetical protein [Klebsiella pneumoniae]ELA1789255.1 hypothetical protein [Klebsiella pneumoniae]HBS6773966.1 hypothetical protein [Klebsiella pneumoniae]